jgi:hypothetical protein
MLEILGVRFSLTFNRKVDMQLNSFNKRIPFDGFAEKSLARIGDKGSLQSHLILYQRKFTA